MQQQNIPIATLVDMHKGCELHLPEIPRHCVWQNTRMRDLLDFHSIGAIRVTQSRCGKPMKLRPKGTSP